MQSIFTSAARIELHLALFPGAEEGRRGGERAPGTVHVYQQSFSSSPSRLGTRLELHVTGHGVVHSESIILHFLVQLFRLKKQANLTYSHLHLSVFTTWQNEGKTSRFHYTRDAREGSG